MRRRTGQVDGLRTAVADHCRAFVARHPRAAGRYVALVEALDSGRPVELTGWEIPQPWRVGVDSWDRLRVERDGSLTMLADTGHGAQ